MFKSENIKTANDISAEIEHEVIVKRKNEIEARLIKIDLESVRPLRAVINTTDTSFDANKLASLDNEAQTLRDELSALAV